MAKSKVTKEEVKIIKSKMTQLKNDNKSSCQKSIPYIDMTKDGICQIDKTHFSKSIQFFDINYRLATLDEKSDIFQKYCDLLNYFDDSIKFQLTFENQNSDVNKLVQELDISKQDDEFNDIREEYSEMLKNQLLKGTNGKVLKKFFTYTIEAQNLREARVKLNSITDEILVMLNAIGVTGKELNGKERLEVLYRSLNPFTDEPFVFDWGYRAKTGMTTKDFIAPPSMKFYKSSFELSKCYGAVYSINILAGELSDEILNDYLSQENLLSVNMHIKPFDQVEAQKFIRHKLTDINSIKIDEQKKAIKAGYDPDILPPSIKIYIEELEKILDDLNSKNERLFNITITIRNFAESKKEMILHQDLLKRITQKNNCILMPLEYVQEQAYTSSLPLGYNSVQVNRVLTTSAIAVFMPFTTKELFQGNKSTYYGLNTLSNNMIMADRKRLKNPNGLYLGITGAGKSFSVKRELFDVFLKTADDIIICDPEGEYYQLVDRLKGQIIKISTKSELHINPMDIVWDGGEDNPIADKSNFIISLCEIIVGGRYGLTAEEKSIIDKCVRQIYARFLNNNPTAEKMPILTDLLVELRKAGEIAMRVANSLEMYTSGSQNVFNHRTNLNINNRLICFDTKELGNQLKRVGMLIIQDTVWNRVSKNRNVKRTCYYIDEFHLLLRDPQTAEYCVEMWKRFRKWGGIPTGITQNVKDLLMSKEIENIFDNSDFIYMLSQAAGDREILADKLHISDQQLQFVTNVGPGQGLIFFGDVILPFKDKFPKDTIMYQLMNTNPDDLSEQKKIETKV